MSVRTTWTNWAGQQVCAPERIVRPTSEQHLAQLVAETAANGGAIRAVGSGHSFTDCACTDGVLVDMTGLQRVLDIDHAAGRVTVEAGIKLHALGPELARHGLSLQNQGDIDAQSISGAVSTATHGTGAAFQNMSSQITGVRLVTADGSVRQLSADGDPDEYLAARVSIGALGVISSLTIQCVPLFTLHRHDQPMPLTETLDRLDEFVDQNDHFEFFVFPYARTALTRRMRRSSEEPVPPPRWRRRLQDDLLENATLSLLCRMGRRLPTIVPQVNRTFTAAFSESQIEDRAYRIYATRRAVRFTEMEYAIPRAHARDAIMRVLELVQRRRLPILFPVEVRFGAPDEAFLSSAYGRDTCYIAVHQFCGMEYESYFRAVEAIMDEYDGRPHWGKRHYQTAASLASRYPEWSRFQVVRRRLDPDGTFANDYTRRVFGGD